MENKLKIKKNTLPILILIILVGGLAIYLNKNTFRKWVDIGIYSNQYHYLECGKLPDYETSKAKFVSKQVELLELIKQLEQTDSSTVPNGQQIQYTILDGVLSGAFIRVRLDKHCNTKAEINATITSNKYDDELKKYFDQNLGEIPYNIINN
jgi:hypothetical protein